MEQFKNSVMIALLPMTSDWCRIELPHMTLVYAGLIEDQKPSSLNNLCKDAMSIAMLSRVLTLRVMGVEVFGDEEKVDVLKLRPTPELYSMRRLVESWNASEHPFSPHVTIGPTGSVLENVPSMLAFDRVMVGWGEEQFVFWMKG